MTAPDAGRREERKKKGDGFPLPGAVIVLEDGRLGVVAETKPRYVERSCKCCSEIDGHTVEGVVLQADHIERFTLAIPFDEPVEVVDEYA